MNKETKCSVVWTMRNLALLCFLLTGCTEQLGPVQVTLLPDGGLFSVYAPRPAYGLCTAEMCMLSLPDGGYALVGGP